MYLDGILNIVVSRTISVVIGIPTCCCPRCGIGRRASPWQGIAAQNVVGGDASCPRIRLLLLKCRIEAVPDRDTVLPRAYIELAHHPHLQVLWRRNVAVPEVSASIGREIVVSEAGADINGHRSVGHTVVERRRVRIAVEVNRMLLEEVGPH